MIQALSNTHRRSVRTLRLAASTLAASVLAGSALAMAVPAQAATPAAVRAAGGLCYVLMVNNTTGFSYCDGMATQHRAAATCSRWIGWGSRTVYGPYVGNGQRSYVGCAWNEGMTYIWTE